MRARHLRLWSCVGTQCRLGPSNGVLNPYSRVLDLLKNTPLPHKSRLHLAPATSSLSTPESHLFEYTSGRWVYNEDKRLKERECIFNVDQLQRLAAQAVSREQSDVVSIEKLGEGASNRAFAICFKDDFRLVARIPYPSIEPKGLVVASETVTLSYLRSKSIPVPEVYGYSCSSDNPAQTEYILMEFCSGNDLGNIWDDLGDGDRLRCIRSLAKLEAQLSNIRLPASGSLYLLRDLPGNAKKVPVEPHDTNSPESIYLGPSTELHFWFGRRGKLHVDRGPFSEPLAAMNAGAFKEMRHLEQHGQALLPFNRFQREVFNYEKQLPSVHLDSLRKYLQVSDHLIPHAKDLTVPILRHPDLRPSNIFVSDDFEITAVIDWQHSAAMPLFLSAGIPEFLHSQPQPNESPEQSNISSEQDNSDEKHRLDLRSAYMSMVERHDPLHFQALSYPFSVGRQKIHRLASDPWQGDNVPLRSSLIFVKQRWSEFTSNFAVPCPISFTEEEERECLRLDDAEQQGVDQLEEFKREIGLGPEGWVSHENYDVAKEAIARMKELSPEGWVSHENYDVAKEAIARMKELSPEDVESEVEAKAIRDHWMYDDMDEDEYA